MTSPNNPLHEQAGIPQQPGPAPTGFAAPPAPEPRPRRRRLWVAVAAVVVLAVAGVGVFFALRPSAEDDAADRCRTEITGKLRSPSTAKFGDAKVSSETGNFGTYFDVSGVVDAQNGFGAMIRGEYRCKVTRESDGRWVVTESSVTNV